MNIAESNTPDSGFEESVAAIMALEAPEKAKPAPKAKIEPSDEEPDEPEEVEESDESEESEQDEEEGTEEADDDEQPEAATLEEIEIKGKRIKLPPDVVAEIKAGTLRQQDYTRKTQKVAETQRQADVDRQQAAQARQQYAQGLEVVSNALRAYAPTPPPAALRDEDPIEYVRQKEVYAEHVQRFQAVSAERHRLTQIEAQESERQATEHLAREASRLPELIPAWKDEKRRKSDAANIRKLLAERGYSDDRIAAISTQSTADEIAILQEWASLKSLFAKKAAAQPVVSKTTAPGPSQKPQSKPGRQRDFARLRETGSVDDAAAAILHLL